MQLHYIRASKRYHNLNANFRKKTKDYRKYFYNLMCFSQNF